jgi:hypothetical protein
MINEREFIEDSTGFPSGIARGEQVLGLFTDEDDAHEHLRREVNTLPQAGPFDPPELTTESPGRCGCADAPDLALAKETVGPVAVQIVYCEACEQVIEQVIGDG